MDTLMGLLRSDGFMPHGYCYLWNSGLVWLHAVSDILIFLSYMAISITLVYFVRKRRDLPFGWMFISFGVFIVACGFTHAMEVWTLWYPNYWAAGGVKAVTAMASVATAVLLVRLVPNALTISSPALLRAEAENRRLAAAIEQVAEAIMITDTAGIIQYVNPAFTWITGYTSEEALKQNSRLLKSGVQDAKVYQVLWKTIQSGKTWQGEIVNRRKDGSLYPEWMTISPVLESAGRTVNYIAIKQDITERKRDELEIINLNRVYAVISQINQLIVRTREANTLFAEVCHIAIGHGKFRMAWIGMMDGKDGMVKPVAWDGVEEGYLKSIKKISVSDSPEGRGPTGTAIREGKQACCNDIRNDSGMAPWRDEALKRGFGSVISLPIIIHGSSVGAFTLYAAEPFFFNEAESKLLEEVTGDISFALEVMEQENQRKRAEEARVLLRKAVDTAGEVIFTTDREGIITFINPEFTRLYGYTAEEVVGKSTPRILKSGVMSAEAYANFWKTILGKRVARTEMINTSKDGRIVFAESSANPILDERGDISGFLAIQQDVTERKQAEEAFRQAEERFRKAFNTNPEPVTISTLADGRYIDVNESFLRIMGYRRQEVIGRTSKEINYWQMPEDRDTFIRQLREHGKISDAEINFRTKSGEKRSGLLSAETIELDGQECLLAVTKDITARKDLEQQFRQAQKMEAIGKLAGGVAHDFNNLLTVINGYAEVMLGQLQPQSSHTNYLNEIRKAGERAAGLTRQLLAFSRQQVLAPQVLDLNQVIANVHTMLKRLIGEDIDLVTTPGQRLGLVKADPGQIDQVLLNLAVNARDAVPKGGKLSIETANMELGATYAREHMTVVPGAYVMLAVSDSGTGMDAETQKRIFEPFFTTKEKGKGTGLGLSTVYGIVKQSEGYIWVYSEVGHGTTFKIYLPRVDAPVAVVGSAKTEAELSCGRETILVVEDDTPIRQLISETLKSKGYLVLEATNGEEALGVAGKHLQTIQLLLTDLVMPGMSGRTLAERMAALHPEAKVLFISGYTDDAVIRHGGLEVGTAFLQKPFTPGVLVKKVHKVLDAGQEGLPEM